MLASLMMRAPLQGGVFAALFHDTPTRGNGAGRKVSEPNYSMHVRALVLDLPAGIRNEARTLLCHYA